MMRFALLLTLTVLTGCVNSAGQPVVTSVNTLCTSTTRYHATDNQVAAMKQDQLLWQPLVDWLASFNKVRDAECLVSPPTSR